MKILIHPNKLLKVVAEPVTNITSKLYNIIEDMKFVMNNNNGCGLAATQVGVDKRVFVYDKDKVIINPRIVRTKNSIISKDEGCLSIPGFTFNIKRSEKVFIVGIDIDEKEIEIEADGILSIIFQHEIDHLNGIVLVDHLSALKKKMYKKKLKKRDKFI